MILTCPECEAQYSLPDDAIPAKGRSVRCANCAHVWMAFPEPAEEEEQGEPTSASTERTEQLAAIKAAMEAEEQFEEKLDSDKDIVSEWADDEGGPDSPDEVEEEEIIEPVEPEESAVATRESVIKRVVIPVPEPETEFTDEIVDTEETIVTDVEIESETMDAVESELAPEPVVAPVNEEEGARREPTLSVEPMAHEEIIAEAEPVKNAGPAVGWIVLFVFLAALLGVFFFAQDRVQALWPAASVLYDMLGF